MFEIVMGIDDFLIQLVKYWIWRLLPENDSRKNVLFLKTSAEGQLIDLGEEIAANAMDIEGDRQIQYFTKNLHSSFSHHSFTSALHYYSTSLTGSENHLYPSRFQTFNRKVF